MRSAEKQLEATHENSSESLEDIFAPHIVVRWMLSVFLLPQTLGKRAFVPKLLGFFTSIDVLQSNNPNKGKPQF